jgi:hypothetical protein
VTRRERDDLIDSAAEERTAADEQSAGLLLGECGEGRIDLAFSAGC